MPVALSILYAAAAGLGLCLVGDARERGNLKVTLQPYTAAERAELFARREPWRWDDVKITRGTR